MKNRILLTLIALVSGVFFISCGESEDKKKNDLIKKYHKMIEVNDYASACFYLQEYLF